MAIIFTCIYIGNIFQPIRATSESSSSAFNVQVSDGLNDATATLTVTIVDINDNAPLFDQSLYDVTVGESQAIGVPLITVSATDADFGVNKIFS